MFRQTGDAETEPNLDAQSDARLEAQLDEIEQSDLTRWLLSAVETYKRACTAAGEEPTEEDAWLVLLSALQLQDAK